MNNIADVIIGQQIVIQSIQWISIAICIYYFEIVAPRIKGANKLPAKVILLKSLHPN